MPQNEVVTLPTRPGTAHSLADIEKLAEAVARSRMFGIATKEQALVLMAISQAEGRHPALAARDYDIIQGRPAKKAEAMLRDFLDAGGKVEWHKLDDDVADATFAHPTGGKIRILWDTARATRAGLSAKEMYKKFPRQMLRSRCVSEGVRTVCPMATSGFYVPEEVRDMPAVLPTGADAVAELDQFAAKDSEPFPARDILAEAREIATGGTPLFREFWAALTQPERDSIRQYLGEFQRTARAADDPFPTDHPATQQPSPVEPEPPAPRRARQAQRSEAAATAAPQREQAPQAPPPGDSGIFEEPPPPADSRRLEQLEIVVPLKGGKPDWRTWALVLLGTKARRCTSSNELADLLGANERNLEQARAPGAMAPADREDMDRVIAEQWQRLPA